jgi:ACS family hexuronate transporter-like MFS transporter
VLSRQRAWVVTIAATLTMTVSIADRGTLAVLAPSVTKALHISESAYGWLASAFSMAYLVGTPLAGWWIDRTGARRGLLASVLTWSLVAALHAIVPGFATLFAMRIALGIVEGPSFPGSAQAIRRVLPPEDQPRGFGVIFTGSSLGGLIAPPLASWLYAQAGWRLAFVGTALFGLVWIPIWLSVTRPYEVAERLDSPGPQATASHRRRPLGEVLRHPAMVRAILAILAVGPAGNVMGAFGAKYLVARFHISQAQVGHYLWLPPLFIDAGALLFGDLAARSLPRRGTTPARAVFAFGAVIAAANALLGIATTPWHGVLLIGLANLGAVGVYAVTTGDLMARIPPESAASAAGLITAGQSLSLILANPIVGWAVGHGHSYGDVGIGLALWVIPGSLIWLLWLPREPAR